MLRFEAPFDFKVSQMDSVFVSNSLSNFSPRKPQGMKEFCGRCIAVPLVKLSAETYSPPDFLPKLEWYRFQSRKDYTGSILAAFELVEVNGGEVLRNNKLYYYSHIS